MEKKKTSFVQGAAVLGVAGLLVKIIGAVFRIPLNNAVGPIGMSYYEVVYPYYSGLLVISSSGLPTGMLPGTPDIDLAVQENTVKTFTGQTRSPARGSCLCRARW